MITNIYEQYTIPKEHNYNGKFLFVVKKWREIEPYQNNVPENQIFEH